ncbi:MAG: heavy metal-associated domain-containing protein [Bacteroidota bacterium]|nr:heavy metal-associated domain-containing protein [Bacteroidota bacterium]
MKSLLFFLISLLFIIGCNQQPKPEFKVVAASTNIVENVKNNNLFEASFSISGMMCKMGCAKAIENNLSKMEGVQKASVDFETSIATVLYNSSLLKAEDLALTVLNTGDAYTVSNMSSASNKKSGCCAKVTCKKETCAKNKT